MKLIVLLFGLVMILSACERSPHEGYKQINSDLHLKLYMLGDGERLPRDGDSVLMRLRISEVQAEPGSLFSTEQWYAVTDLRKSAYDQLLIRMHEGDSMSLIAKARHLPWQALLHGRDTITIGDHNELRTEVSLIAIRTAAMMEAEEDRLRAADPQGHEQKVIFAFLDRLGPNWQKWGSSLVHYAIEGTATDTNQVKAGDLVTISYTGRRLQDDQVFDSTSKNGGPLSFRFGDKHQVMNGLEVAIHLLREGQEGEFLFPSEYAFGPRGIQGMIEPYTPVVYTVRLEEVHRVRARRSSIPPA